MMNQNRIDALVAEIRTAPESKQNVINAVLAVPGEITPDKQSVIAAILFACGDDKLQRIKLLLEGSHAPEVVPNKLPPDLEVAANIKVRKRRVIDKHSLHSRVGTTFRSAHKILTPVEVHQILAASRHGVKPSETVEKIRGILVSNKHTSYRELSDDRWVWRAHMDEILTAEESAEI